MKAPTRFKHSFSLAACLIIAGLAVQLLTLFWAHPLSFVLFLGMGLSLTVAGILLYFYAILTWERKTP